MLQADDQRQKMASTSILFLFVWLGLALLGWKATYVLFRSDVTFFLGGGLGLSFYNSYTLRLLHLRFYVYKCIRLESEFVVCWLWNILGFAVICQNCQLQLLFLSLKYLGMEWGLFDDVLGPCAVRLSLI